MGRIDLNELTAASRALNEPVEARRELWGTFRERASELDGRVYECVSSTRIYCRPTCGAHRPKFENCFFVASAAEVEALGYRPCMKCRPELAPGSKPVGEEGDLAWRASQLVREFCSGQIEAGDAVRRLDVSQGALEAAIERRYGTSFDGLLLGCRLKLAKMLLTDTRVDYESIAGACGFSDSELLAAAMKASFRKGLDEYRKRDIAPSPTGAFGLRLAYREPYEYDRLLGFFRARELAGVEVIDGKSYSRTARIAGSDGAVYVGWLRVENDSARHCLRLVASESLLPVVSQLIARVRRQFDLDCDPSEVHAGLEPLDTLVPGANVAGTRVPGAFDSFEIAVRAVLGQQVSVKAANKLAARIVERFGAPVATDVEGLGFLFPSAGDFLAMGPIEDALGELGVIKTRSRTIRALAELAVAGGLDLNPAADVAGQMRKLLAVKGIGVWSQNYIAMRTLGYTDAFLEADIGIKRALPELSAEERAAAVEPCRPWRAYANVCLWNSLSS